ncbi:MAG TPA: amidase [Acidimicrobiia bacterium]|jgi:amidase
MDELAFLDVVAQAELVRSGECSPRELVEAAIARIEKLNPELNAVIHPLFDKARAAAAGALPDGPFRGVPFCMKDAVCHTAGDPYHLGMRFLKERNWVEADDTYLARRFRDAGFVFVGKTNTPELATSITTEPLAYGPTRNPWDVTRSPGGSSGGSAAAVASGMVPAAHANDMGGSIRAPASECGLVGLKPSRARTTLGPSFGEYWGPLTHEFVVVRSVRDSAAILDAVAGPAPGDPYTAPAPARPFASEVGADPGRLRIGLRTTIPAMGRDAHPECVAAVQAAGRLLERAGHTMEVASPAALDDEDVFGPFATIMGAAIARDLDRWGERTGHAIGPDDVEPGNWMMAEVGRAITGAQYLAAVEALQAYTRHVASWWAASDEGPGFDLLVMPTISQPPPELGRMAPLADPGESLGLQSQLAHMTVPWNASGQPAMSVPLHWTPDGLPVGVQLVAAYGREDVLFRVAAQLEQAAPWSDRRPAVHA